MHKKILRGPYVYLWQSAVSGCVPSVHDDSTVDLLMQGILSKQAYHLIGPRKFNTAYQYIIKIYQVDWNLFDNVNCI